MSTNLRLRNPGWSYPRNLLMSLLSAQANIKPYLSVYDRPSWVLASSPGPALREPASTPAQAGMSASSCIPITCYLPLYPRCSRLHCSSPRPSPGCSLSPRNPLRCVCGEALLLLIWKHLYLPSFWSRFSMSTGLQVAKFLFFHYF